MDAHPGTVMREAARDRSSDAAAGASHQNDLASEITKIHETPPIDAIPGTIAGLGGLTEVTTHPTWMRRDIDAALAVCGDLLRGLDACLPAIAAAIRAASPRFAIVCGRGSSGHAGTFLRYLLGLRGGLIAADASPSILTVHRAAPAMTGALFVVLSQSGRSPDLVATAAAARETGATTLAIVNDPVSPAALACAHVLPILAGPERAVAATKTVINTLAAGAALVAALAGDRMLGDAVAALPSRLADALTLAWDGWSDALVDAPVAYVLARGPALAIAQELALKLGECVGLPALAYSTAEFRHGPRAALAPGMPVLVLHSDDASAADTATLAEELRAAGNRVFVTGADLRAPPAADALIDPIALLVPGYGAIERAARLRGRDPDAPPGLSKVTRTL
jgi:glucosamine--fructose-6-phosphate aminotransferase (isomerizing)